MTREILTQAYSAMRHDLRKTILTMLGMAWGIATVVLLLAYGEGFGRAIQGIFRKLWCDWRGNLWRPNFTAGWREQGRSRDPLHR